MSLLHTHILKAAGLMPLATYTAVETAFPTVTTPALELGEQWALITPQHVLFISGIAAVLTVIVNLRPAVMEIARWVRMLRNMFKRRDDD